MPAEKTNEVIGLGGSLGKDVTVTVSPRPHPQYAIVDTTREKADYI